jgi:hypothetical protein
MRQITGSAFKTCLAEILGDTTRADWGGEMSDHFAAHLHLCGKRTTAAFVLKGPGNGFSPMTLRNLGKNSDQIYRLAQEPAQLLVVQHCHDITAAVRETLRAFAVQPPALLPDRRTQQPLWFSTLKGISVTAKAKQTRQAKPWFKKNWVYVVGVAGIISATVAVINFVRPADHPPSKRYRWELCSGRQW